MEKSNYHHSFFKKISNNLYGKEILQTIEVKDEDGDVIDNVIFIETKDNGVVGFYINGSNPLISTNKIDEFDSFNLYALYEKLTSTEKNIPSHFEVDYLEVFFHPEYNELLAIYLTSHDFLSSLLIVFLTDEINIFSDINKDEIINVIKDNLIQFKDSKLLSFHKEKGNESWIES
ncbi:hypothetical protein HF675_09365 [Serratia sp. JUb9]|uniref:hypothetical protein n=1 Tax=Serratia sp. JUb9 TaxID=2724469 RepID=UPI00164E250D|nr:hypothetical protein [Serratia sp. JUb9]QNK34213.1 hypothetical protein HF675_09365 [Serratia sp. JUb9]